MSYYITKQTKANSPTNNPSLKKHSDATLFRRLLRPISIDFENEEKH